MLAVGFEPTRRLTAEDLKSSPLTTRANQLFSFTFNVKFLVYFGYLQVESNIIQFVQREHEHQ